MSQVPTFTMLHLGTFQSYGLRKANVNYIQMNQALTFTKKQLEMSAFISPLDKRKWHTRGLGVRRVTESFISVPGICSIFWTPVGV